MFVISNNTPNIPTADVTGGGRNLAHSHTSWIDSCASPWIDPSLPLIDPLGVLGLASLVVLGLVLL